MARNAAGDLTLEGEITEDGRLVVTLPPGVPRGRVRVTVELTPEALDVSEDDLHGQGLTAEEIAASPDLGAWSRREQQSASYRWPDLSVDGEGLAPEIEEGSWEPLRDRIYER